SLDVDAASVAPALPEIDADAAVPLFVRAQPEDRRGRRADSRHLQLLARVALDGQQLGADGDADQEWLSVRGQGENYLRVVGAAPRRLGGHQLDGQVGDRADGDPGREGDVGPADEAVDGSRFRRQLRGRGGPRLLLIRLAWQGRHRGGQNLA